MYFPKETGISGFRHDIPLLGGIYDFAKTRGPATEIATDIVDKIRDYGPAMSKSGANRNILRMVPPMCIQESDVATVEEALERCFAGY